MQVNIKVLVLLLVIVILTSVIYFVDKNRSSGNKKSLSSSSSSSSTASIDSIKNNLQQTILDRQPLERENPTLLPANESIQNSYKDWNGLDNDLYSSDVPLFTSTNSSKPVPLDLNSNHRRVNFY